MFRQTSTAYMTKHSCRLQIQNICLLLPQTFRLQVCSSLSFAFLSFVKFQYITITHHLVFSTVVHYFRPVGQFFQPTFRLALMFQSSQRCSPFKVEIEKNNPALINNFSIVQANCSAPLTIRPIYINDPSTPFGSQRVGPHSLPTLTPQLSTVFTEFGRQYTLRTAKIICLCS